MAALPELRIDVDARGVYSAEIVLPRIEAYPAPATGPADGTSLRVVALPFTLLDGARVVSAPDVSAVPLACGEGYGILVVAASLDRPDVRVRIEEAGRVEQLEHMKARLSLNASFPYASEAERGLFGLPGAVSNFHVRIALSEAYPDADVNFRSPFIRKVDERTYEIADLSRTCQDSTGAWLVFPSQRDLDYALAKAVISLFVGLAGIPFQLRAVQRRQLKLLLFVGVLSGLVVGSVLFFARGLASYMEYVAWVAGVVPNALYGLLACVYLLLASRQQVTVSGHVHVDGAPRVFGDVRLQVTSQGRTREIRHSHNLDSQGRYLFHVWQKPPEAEYKVVAKYPGARPSETQVRTLSHGEHFDFGLLSLTSGP